MVAINRIYKTGLLLVVVLLVLHLQETKAQSTTKDTAAYSLRNIGTIEQDVMLSFYQQDGENSAVTGGVGSESLVDGSFKYHLMLVREGENNRTHTYGASLGVDVYSSASSDEIDPNTLSGASSGDVRVYPSLSWEMDDREKNYAISTELSFSNEYDYTSLGLGLGFTKRSASENTALGVKLNAYVDSWKVIRPIELRINSNDDNYDRSPRYSFSGQVFFNQVLTQRVKFSLLTDVIYQTGFLSTPFHRVYFSGEKQARVEEMPDTRMKFPFGLRVSYFATSRLITKWYYRYYTDDWGIQAHTASLEVPFKLKPLFSIYPFYRYYTQTSSTYFAKHSEHVLNSTEFFTSDYDLSEFESHSFGMGLRWVLLKPLIRISGFSDVNKLDYIPQAGLPKQVNFIQEIECRYTYYSRSTSLVSHALAFYFKI